MAVLIPTPEYSPNLAKNLTYLAMVSVPVTLMVISPVKEGILTPSSGNAVLRK